MPKFVDRTGFRYGRLTAMEKAGRNNHKKVLWRCLCDCGVETFVDSDQARNIRGFGRVRGVRRVGSRWYAVIGVNHGRVRSRSLDTLEQAMAERKRLEKELWGRD